MFTHQSDSNKYREVNTNFVSYSINANDKNINNWTKKDTKQPTNILPLIRKWEQQEHSLYIHA